MGLEVGRGGEGVKCGEAYRCVFRIIYMDMGMGVSVGWKNQNQKKRVIDG